jgi:hypothetical protein
LGILKFMPVTAKRSMTFAADLAGDAVKPRAELYRFVQRLKLAIRAQETFLHHVVDGRPVTGNAGHHSCGQPCVAIVQQAERLTIAGERFGDQLGVSRRDRCH